MYQISSHFSVVCFRSKVLAWIVLITLVYSFIPAISFAQQPTATISAVKGTVLVNGQEQGKGTVLSAGDVIETQAGASVVLKLSDGSEVELGENTKLDLAELSQTATGARVSRIKMAWGWIRAKLSSGHQKEGSSFDIETPNALVGVKFSVPVINVSHNLAKAETVASSPTVDLNVENRFTGEKKVVLAGSTAIITTLGIEIVSGIIGASVGAGAGGTSTGKIVAIGVVALAAAGGVAAIAASSGGDNGGGSSELFTGNWYYPYDGEWEKTLNLTQNGTSISGNFRFLYMIGDPCAETKEGTLQGTATGSSAILYLNGTITSSCDTETYPYTLTEECTLENNGETLSCEGYDYHRL